jgi:hypothetical protein
LATSAIASGLCPISVPVNLNGIGDGCTTAGLEYVLPDVGAFRSTFTPACNNHDRCYTSLGGTYSLRDDAMLSDMRSACRDSFSPWFPVELAACYAAAQNYYTAVKAWGAVKNPLPNFHNDAFNRIFKLFGGNPSVNEITLNNINLYLKCATSAVEQTNLFTPALQAVVNNAFGQITGRPPTVFEFFEVVIIGGQQIYSNNAGWINVLNNYASSRRSFPAAPNVNYTSNGYGLFSLTNPSSFANYTWFVNGQVVQGNSISIALPETKFDTKLAISGYVYGVDRAYSNNRSITPVKKVIVVKGWCSPDPKIRECKYGNPGL